MDKRVSLQPAYVLHTRPFQNSSLLVDFFTIDYGRVKAVAKGARGAKSRIRPLLQPFHPLLISLSGRTDLKTLTAAESMHEAMRLEGTRLYSGLYVNELLIRLLQNQEEHRALYGFYQDTLVALQGASRVDTILRHFEFSLLVELGYGINFESESQQTLLAEQTYQFDPKQGFYVATEPDARQGFRGSDLIAIRESRLDEPEVALAAKRLARMALAEHLGMTPLTSRELFTSRRTVAVANGQQD